MERGTVRAASNAIHGVTASSSTPSGSKGTRLPLVDCPKCAVRLICIRSKQTETYGELFYLCPNNIKEDPRTCKFIRSQKQYEAYLDRLEDEQALDAADEPTQSFGDVNTDIRMQFFRLKAEVDEMKQKVQFFEMKMQRSEMKFLGTETPVAVFICLGVVIGMLASAMWKQM